MRGERGQKRRGPYFGRGKCAQKYLTGLSVGELTLHNDIRSTKNCTTVVPLRGEFSRMPLTSCHGMEMWGLKLHFHLASEKKKKKQGKVRSVFYTNQTHLQGRSPHQTPKTVKGLGRTWRVERGLKKKVWGVLHDYGTAKKKASDGTAVTGALETPIVREAKNSAARRDFRRERWGREREGSVRLAVLHSRTVQQKVSPAKSWGGLKT